ncbi:MAG TPA: protein-disulfide reductase DsbD domain-containing protein, partial [Verrucomicrobiae bacterium]|nr:protein-disulfide reductase DsbD domain-containing protein [Verrucomicrobiae bacterium]
MDTLFRVLLLALVCLAPASYGAAQTKASLILSHASAKPGETITAGLRLVSAPGWHTYWRNPGTAGIATSIEWELPAGISAGAIQWPIPEKMLISKQYAYVYEKETILLIPLTISAQAAAGEVKLKAAVSWLECSEKTCVPQDGKVEATLVLGAESKLSENAALLESAGGKLPQPTVSAFWERGSAESRNLVIQWTPAGAPSNPDFFPDESMGTTIAPETEVLRAEVSGVRIRKPVKAVEGKWPNLVSGLLLDGTGGDNRGAYHTTFTVPPIIEKAAEVSATAGSMNAPPIQIAAPAAPASLMAVLGLAFLGGLILNVMPCVLPVIALKILGFVNQSREEPKRIRQLGILYMLGVLASFLVLAGGLLAAREAAGDVNWGMQMQNPYFVVGMTVLVTLVALNLWGVFEITVSGKALGAASELAGREGKSGAFYNGILATLLATPCTAPALGAAVGSVLTQPAYVVIITFLMIGLGLALPYVLLSWN